MIETYIQACSQDFVNSGGGGGGGEGGWGARGKSVKIIISSEIYNHCKNDR